MAKQGPAKSQGKTGGKAGRKNAGKSRGKAPGKVKARKLTPQQKAMYRRRRIVALVGILAVFAVGLFCVYSLIRGAVFMRASYVYRDATTLARSAEPSPKATSLVPDCGAGDLSMELSADPTTVAVGGSVTFTATMAYTGTSKEGCFVNGANDSRVLVITSGSQTIYRSDACEDTYRPLLLFSGATDKQTLTWNTNATSDSCVADADLPHVEAGTYVATLELAGDSGAKSSPVTITVQ